MASSSLTTATLFLTAIALFIISPSQSQMPTCTSQTFTNNRIYSFCNDLPFLNSYVHWSYDPDNSTLYIAFIATPAGPSGWVSWAINPTSTGMLGSQALIAFRESNGGMVVNTYNVSSYREITESMVWYEVRNSSAEFSGGMIRMFATSVLPERGRTTLNQVWQVGPSVTGGVPDKHDFLSGNMNSKSSLDLLRGHSISSTGASDNPRTQKRNIFALFLRPGKDHKYRFYWNIYHHSFGYAIVILGIINVFKGFAILNPDPMWRRAYVILIFTLGAISVFLEAITWVIVLRRKKSPNSTKPYDGLNIGHGRQEPPYL